MKLTSHSFDDGAELPAAFAFADVAAAGHVQFAANRNPHLRWSGAPPGTRSYAIVCHDPDVPSRPDDVNKEGREVPASLPRVVFHHWLLLDIPASQTEIEEGAHSLGVVARGKAGPAAPGGLRHGINDYTGWFAADDAMRGDYHGYDGPCPPWNDSIVHHYVFTVYALDTERVAVQPPLSGQNVLDALRGHVLAETSITATYTLNSRLRGTPGAVAKRA
jgi:hypothetical protein